MRTLTRSLLGPALTHLALTASLEAQAEPAPRAAPQQPAAHSEAGAAAQEAEAEELIRQGIALRKMHDDHAALQRFEQAYARTRSPQALAQVALAEQALGRWLRSHEHLQAALAAHGDVWIDGHRPVLLAAQREIASQLGTLQVFCNVDHAAVLLDGQLRGYTPLSQPLPVVAGQSVLSVSAKGYFDVTRPIRVDPQSLARVEVRLTPLGADGRPAPAPVERTTRDVFMYASLGLAALGLTTAVTGYVMREVNITTYNDDSLCAVRDGVPRAEECPGEYDGWRRGEVLMIIGTAGAAVFGGIGVYMWLERPSAAASETGSARLRGLSIKGTF